jgi:hypothetical protein
MNPTAKQLAVIDEWPVYGTDGQPLEPVRGQGEYSYEDDFDSPESETYFQTWGQY